MSKLRLSSHTLEIERGRYTKVPAEERFCAYCKQMGQNTVEDENHFLLKCPMSDELRDKYLQSEIVNNPHISDDEKLSQLLTDSDLKKTAKFIFLSFEHRDISLDVLNTVQELTENVENLVNKSSDPREDTAQYEIKKTSHDGMKITLAKIAAYA